MSSTHGNHYFLNSPYVLIHVDFDCEVRSLRDAAPKEIKLLFLGLTGSILLKWAFDNLFVELPAASESGIVYIQ